MADTARGPVTIEELTRAQQQTVRRVAEARATVPAFTVAAEAPGAPLPALVAAVATALRERPDVNGAYRDGHLERYGRVNVAVSTGDATLVVHDADTSDAAQIGAALDRLRARAAAGELTAAETAGPTFVIAPSSARRLEPVVAPGFAAVLGAGAPDERAVVDDGALTTGTRMDLVLACDARALSAQAGASFLARLVELLAQ